MFKYDINTKFRPGVLLGYYNIEPPFFTSIKNCLEEKYKNNINYIEITNEKLKIQSIKRRKEKNFEEIGMISADWIEKMKDLLPGVIMQMMDITELTSVIPVDMNKIIEIIIKEIKQIKTSYQSSSQFIIIKNLKKIYGLEDSIKNQILSRFKYLKEKSIFFINDPNYLTTLDIIKKIAGLIKDEISSFYSSKIKYYRNKYKNHENNEQKEYAIKYLIKTFLISYLSNIINIDDSINYFDYIQKAYNILSNKLIKKSYLFSEPNIKVIYLELKNIADFLILQLLLQKNISLDDIANLIIKHLINFDFINFNYDKRADFHLLINTCKNMKDIYFINMLWKHSWYTFILEKYKKIDLVDINNMTLKGYIINNLIHLYSFLDSEPNFLQKIFSQSISELNYKKSKKIKYIEKIPNYYEVDGEDIVGKLSDEENLQLYISELILQDKDLLNSNNILKIIEQYIYDSNTNYYDFFLLNEYCFKNNGSNNKILEKLLQNSYKYLIKFPNIFSNLSTYLNKYILNYKIDNEKKENYDIFKMIEFLILYASVSNNNLTDEEVKKINELLSYNINVNNNIIKLNCFENNIFNIEVSYNVKEIKPLDIITTNINISLLRKDIILNIHKIIIYFPKSYKNKNEKYYNEIILNKVLLINNPIKVSFNNLVKFFFNNLYVNHIDLYLKNQVIIQLVNKEKRNIVFNDKNSNLINENDIIDVNMSNSIPHNQENNNNETNKKDKSKVIIVGKNENHLFYINYKIKINNKDIYIKHIKVLIKLISNYTKSGDEIKTFEFKTINNTIHNNCDNNELILEYDNINLDQNLPFLDFILQIKETGNFIINYEISFTLINKKCPDDYCILKFKKNLLIQSIDTFKYSNVVKSSMYFINQKSKIKAYPINYPLNIISYLENMLLEDIIIKKIIYLPSTNSIQINSPIEKLFLKKQNFTISFLSNEKISLHIKIISKENLNASIGKIKILWVSHNLYNHKYFNESMLNESIFDLNHLIITKLPLKIQGTYINKDNKYQITIKNLESISKIIKLSMKEININQEEEKFNLCGKTDINELLLPLKEFNIQYNIYDKRNGSNFEDIKENINYKFNNLITLNEYNITDNKDKFDSKALRNIIYYFPEMLKLTN